LKDSLIPSTLTAFDLNNERQLDWIEIGLQSSREGVTWAHLNSLEPVTKGGNSGIAHTGDNHERAKSQTFRFTMWLYCIFNSSLSEMSEFL
jgi:hypothetical protein